VGAWLFAQVSDVTAPYVRRRRVINEAHQGGGDLGFSQFSLAFLTVVVRHCDDRKDEVDQVEWTEKDDADEERHVPQTVRPQNLPQPTNRSVYLYLPEKTIFKLLLDVFKITNLLTVLTYFRQYNDTGKALTVVNIKNRHKLIITEKIATIE